MSKRKLTDNHENYIYCLITITKTKFVDQKLLMLDAYFCQKKVEIN